MRSKMKTKLLTSPWTFQWIELECMAYLNAERDKPLQGDKRMQTASCDTHHHGYHQSGKETKSQLKCQRILRGQVSAMDSSWQQRSVQPLTSRFLLDSTGTPQVRAGPGQLGVLTGRLCRWFLSGGREQHNPKYISKLPSSVLWGEQINNYDNE